MLPVQHSAEFSYAASSFLGYTAVWPSRNIFWMMGELVDRYGRLVYAVARRSGLSEADADEVFQNVFTIVCRKLETVREHDRLVGWLARTAAREAGRVGQRTRRAAPIPDHLEAPVESEEDLATIEQEHLVREALRKLGGRCERLLVALFLTLGEPDYDTIAAEMGMRVGSIGPTRARCFRKLETILEEMGIGADSLGR